MVCRIRQIPLYVTFIESTKPKFIKVEKLYMITNLIKKSKSAYFSNLRISYLIPEYLKLIINTKYQFKPDQDGMRKVCRGLNILYVQTNI